MEDSYTSDFGQSFRHLCPKKKAGFIMRVFNQEYGRICRPAEIPTDICCRKGMTPDQKN